MPTKDTLQILLPRAMDRGRGVIAVRSFDGQIFAKRNQDFIAVQLEKIQYAPAWAKVEATIVVAGRSFVKTSGDSGTIAIEATATEYEPFAFVLENNSIDTEVMFTCYFRGFQYGEG